MAAYILGLLAISAVASARRDFWSFFADRRDSGDCDDRVWRFQMTDDWGGYEYLDDEGRMQGFLPDMIKAVCQKAGKKCWWTIDDMSNCWQSSKGVELPGQGLMEGWYDGCVGLYPTPDRQNSFDFTTGFLRKSEGALFALRSKRSKNISNIKGQRIGFLDGWAFNRKCVARQSVLSNNQIGDYEAVYYDTPSEVEEALVKKEIDYFILASGYSPRNANIVRKGPALDCTSDGSAVMVRYGSRVIGWWNEAMAAMLESGEWAELCAQAKRKHGFRGAIECDI